MNRLLFVFCLVLIICVAWTKINTFDKKDKLSEYNFFVGKLADLSPASDILPYTLNTPLFSNYSEKLRFVKIPKGETVSFNDTAVFDFPVGTVLIKNFYYANDFRKPEKGKRILETRLLVHDKTGWQAYPYIWNDEQSEAYYDPAGESKTISYVNSAGKKVNTTYVIPNKNQCKGCHIRDSKLMPIGPSARQLNRQSSLSQQGVTNQLETWKELGILRGLPQLNNVSRLAVWDDATSGDLNGRARAYLDANCGHCHSRLGPASTSGLFLNIHENDPSHLGVNKSPVAAGRGSGDLKYDIVPGDPDHSIMLFRMKTNDPAIAMPEIGREQIHKEGVDLIAEWIRKNTFAVQ